MKDWRNGMLVMVTFAFLATGYIITLGSDQHDDLRGEVNSLKQDLAVCNEALAIQ
ncbi:hypothetical protein KKG41_03830 [Patescibacteria group bacterium]|nr:hypothetical protein [Patescibacteria group bacterium]MBU1890031.1 hypothetical protein [Patescibacteria group bacterium]